MIKFCRNQVLNQFLVAATSKFRGDDLSRLMASANMRTLATGCYLATGTNLLPIARKSRSELLDISMANMKSSAIPLKSYNTQNKLARTARIGPRGTRDHCCALLQLL